MANLDLSKIHSRASIRTRYTGPTNYKGSRVTASRDGEPRQRITLSWDDALNPEQNHAMAAQAFIDKYLQREGHPTALLMPTASVYNAEYYWRWTWEGSTKS